MSLRRLLVVSGIYLIMAVYSFRPCLAGTVGEMTGITGFNVACDLYLSAGADQLGTQDSIVKFAESVLHKQDIRVLQTEDLKRDIKAGVLIIQVRSFERSGLYWYSIIVEPMGNAYVAANHNKRWLVSLDRFDGGGNTDKVHFREGVYSGIAQLLTAVSANYKGEN